MALRYAFAAKKAPNPTDRHVGSRVRMRRILLAMSQEELGAALGLSFQQVQKYERGANRIGASRLQQISHILQVPVEFFFAGAPNASARATGDGPRPAACRGRTRRALPRARDRQRAKAAERGPALPLN
jgi:transcriptional regulator with XRE-family HTH domain